MPFLIRPPLHSDAADTPSRTYIVIEPDHSERSILRDLQAWGWRITRHNFSDEEFIQTMINIERDVKQRRRQTHAIAGELHGYRERLTLEEVWEREAEREIGDDAHGQENDQVRSCSQGSERSETVDKWLRAIDRTRQSNGYLDYTEPHIELPRLIEHGLDHHCADCKRKLAWVQYRKPHPERRQNASVPRLNTAHDIKSKELPPLPPLQQRRRTVCLLFPCYNNRSKDTTNVAKPKPTPPPRALLQRRHSSPSLQGSTSSSPISLIFPHESISQRAYIRHTRPGLPRSNHPITSQAPPGVGADPYGWLRWDRDIQRMEDIKAQLKFFVGRERRSFNSLAGVRREELRRRKRLGEEIVGRNVAWEEHGKEKGKRLGQAKGDEDTDGEDVLMFLSAWNSFGRE